MDFLSNLQGCVLLLTAHEYLSRCGLILSAGILHFDFRESRLMVLIYESDPLDNEDARGRFYHVCRGRIDRTEIQLPVDEKIYECAVCGIDLEAEDFWLARQKGSV
jgi:hypothetical protein